jgi:N-methylhydantoinase A
MRRQAQENFARIGIPQAQLSYQPSVEMRYAGQFHEVEIDLPPGELNIENLQALLKNFHAKYERMYTYSMPWRAAEFLTFHLKVTAPRRPLRMATNVEAVSNIESARRGSRRCLFDGNSQRVETPVYDWDHLAPGHQLSGPALIDDKTTTVLVVPGFTCEVDPYCNLVLRAQKFSAVDDSSASESLKQAGQRALV